MKAARQARQQYVVLALCVLPKVHGSACSQFLRPVVQPTYGDVGTKEFLFRIFLRAPCVTTLLLYLACVQRWSCMHIKLVHEHRVMNMNLASLGS